MPFSKEFERYFREEAKMSDVFRNELLKGAIEEFRSGDIKVGKKLLHDYIKAEITSELEKQGITGEW